MIASEVNKERGWTLAAGFFHQIRELIAYFGA